MKNNVYFGFIVISVILLFSIITPGYALNDPVPHVSATIFYPDTCNPEFQVDFEISNLGARSSSNSYLAISLSSHLDFVTWHTTPEIPDLMVRVFEIGYPIFNMSGLPISTENLIIEAYNHSFDSDESVIVTMFFEMTLYQSSTEWIKYNLVMYPEITNSQSLSIVTDPAIPNIKNQQGYPVHELVIPINNTTFESDPEDIEIVPEFSSLILLILFPTITIIATIYRKSVKENKQNFDSNPVSS